MNTTTLGSDPEFFIQTHDGRLKSIIGLIGGTKRKPKKIGKGFAIQEDNVAAEYNIPASRTREEFITNILRPQQYIANLLQTNQFTVSRLASASFPPEELLDPKAQEFGCDPDFDAWTGKVNDKPVCDDPTFRTCGGHIHIGLENKDPLTIMRVIRNMDKFVGVWSVLVDADDKRRKLYGKPGSFRPQPHGCEYRTLSNFWIFDPALIGEVWDRTQMAVGHGDDIPPTSGEAAMIQHIINKADKTTAKSYLKTHGLL